MAAYLGRHGASPTRVREILRQLRAWGYLDDEAFAVRWAQGRIARRPVGRARLEAELLAKGFTEATTSRTLRDVFGDSGETEMAQTLLDHVAAGGRRSVAQQAALLRRSGFQEETIDSVLGVDWAW